MYCNNCETQNPDNADFCSKCGNNLKPVSQTLEAKATISSRGVPGTEKDVILHRILAVIIDYIIMGFISVFIFVALIGTAIATLGTAIATLSVPVILSALVGIWAGFIFSIILVMITWILYGIILETWKGQTIGKMVMGIIVVKENGEPCDFMAALLRNVFRIIDILPQLYLIGFIFIALSEKKQRLGDRLAGTIVVKVKKVENN